MKLGKIAVLGSLALLVLSSAAVAGVDFNGKLWSEYKYDATSEQGHLNGFDVTRAFLQANYKYDDTWAANMLVDAVRGQTISVNANGSTAKVSGGISNAYLWSYLRGAYVQGSNLWGGNGSMRFGLQPNLYNTFVDGVTKTRWLGKDLPDQAGLLKVASAGVSGMGEFGSMIKYSILLHNGQEGLTAAGASDNVIAHAEMVNVSPFVDGEGYMKKMTLTLSNETHGTTKSSSNMSFALTNETDMVDFAVEYNMFSVQGGTKANSFGPTINYKMMDGKASLYGRYFTGNGEWKDVRMGSKGVWTVGPTYNLVMGKVSTALLYEVQGSRTTNPDQRTVYWKWAANF